MVHVHQLLPASVTATEYNILGITPDGIWFLVPFKENTQTQQGHWKAKGETREIFSNSVIIGWETTLEFYEGQVPRERKTDWVMQEYTITYTRIHEDRAAEVLIRYANPLILLHGGMYLLLILTSRSSGGSLDHAGCQLTVPSFSKW